MSFSMHSVVVRSNASMLRHALVWLERAQVHADAKKFDSANYLTMRLAPDMLPFSTQVMIACEIAKTGAARVLGQESPKCEQVDTSLLHLRQRIEQALAYLDGLSPEQLDAAGAQSIVVPRRGQEALTFECNDFVQCWSQPNFFFHATMMYALLRHAGVELGKADYLGIY